MDMTDKVVSELTQILAANSGAPFLFIGSGFSRRYIGLEQWSELLELFCNDIKDFGFYYSDNNAHLPKTASAMSRDFNKIWWDSEQYSSSRNEFSKQVNSSSSALKYEISKYLKNKNFKNVEDPVIIEELESLSSLNVDGIITTNWDLFLENLFPDYKVYVGQEELLFSNPQSIAEIYKIHGCSSQPSSLVLTDEDYQDFDSKNSYLAAKLITIFIEHPIIFIGYSISDENIQNIISSIVNCLGKDKLNTFSQNLIFIDRNIESNEASISDALITIGDIKLSIKYVKTNNFNDVYKAIESTKRKIPARILRYCKEQMYDLVKSNSPETRLAVLDIDEIENKEDIEFVVGIGVAQKNSLSEVGYNGIDIDRIFLDIITNDENFDSKSLLNSFYQNFKKLPNKYVPIFKYLREVGVNSIDELIESDFNGIAYIAEFNRSFDPRVTAHQKHFDLYWKDHTMDEIIKNNLPEKASLLIPFCQSKDLEILKNFLEINKDKLKSSNSQYASYFRKLACLYDYLKYGF